MDTNKTGAYLAMLRKARGMTQEAAAELLGVSNKTVSKWETGGGFPEITVLPALAELYGVTTDDILAGETRRREGPPETAAMKRRLMSRLRLGSPENKPEDPDREKTTIPGWSDSLHPGIVCRTGFRRTGARIEEPFSPAA